LKNLLNISLFLIFVTSFSASAQIVTSKIEAQKKGLYAYNDKQVSSPAQAMAKAQAAQKNAGNDAPVIKRQEVLFLDNDVVVINDEPVTTDKAKAKGGPKKPEAPKTTNRKLIVTDEPTSPDFEAAPEENYFAQQIINNAMQFEGVRYRGGGTTPAGMDCSGMVYATFQIFDVTLPRSSAAMAAGAGQEVQLAEVKKGDLLFFSNNRHRRGINHVGLVTEVTPEGEVKFIHASTSHGVMVSSMNDAYHSRTFVQANRVIEEPVL
jgi:lipoprotein Spr